MKNKWNKFWTWFDEVGAIAFILGATVVTLIWSPKKSQGEELSEKDPLVKQHLDRRDGNPVCGNGQ